MRQSQLFTKTLKAISREETSVNAQLLARGGFVQKVMAGVYTFLPLGLRVLQKIEDVIRQEMDAIGGQEVLMPSMQPKENWQKTKRWETLDVLFKVLSHYDKQYALGPTHEEIVVPMAQQYVFSYDDLPFAVYQIQTKFRDEPRSKSGLLRGREFRMKDLYSFHTNEADFESYYDTATRAYHKIFARLGLKAIYTEASGGTFSRFSHEFQVPIPSGEDTIYVCQKCALAKNREIFSEQAKCSNCRTKSKWEEIKASEVGNIFPLKTKFSEAFNLTYTTADGSKKPVIMGCYGIGSSRVMGTIVEASHDDKGIIWPESVAPFEVHLLDLTPHPSPLHSTGAPSPARGEGKAEKVYHALQKAGIEVFYDDREVTAGVKFADSDLLGIPYRLVVSEKTKDKVEVKKRSEKEAELVELKEFISKIK